MGHVDPRPCVTGQTLSREHKPQHPPSLHNPGPVNNELFYYVHVGCNDNHILQVLRLIPRPRPLTSDNARMFELYPGSQPRAPVSLSKQLPNIIKDNHLCSNNLQNYDRPE